MDTEFLGEIIAMKKPFFACAGIAALLLSFSCTAKAQESSAPDLTKAFMDAGLPLLREQVSLRDFSLPLAAQGRPERNISPGGLKGKVVFLNFWATWCGPCRDEMPSMEALYSRYRENGLEILAVNIQEPEGEVLAFMGNNSLSFPAVLDRDGRVSASYGVQAIPSSFIINREGKIIARVVGSIDWDTPKIRGALELLLNMN
jgi:thiol-disulfide isomerase/thioredoxin